LETILIFSLHASSLRNLVSWCESRELFNEEATKIRAEFDANKNLAIGIKLYVLEFATSWLFIVDSALVTRLVREAKERLQAQTHPDPYIMSYMPGGSLFMRNPALPYEALYPDGIPSHIHT